MPQLTAYEIIPGDDSGNTESEQTTVRNDEPEKPLDADRYSQIDSQQVSDVPTGRESRMRKPPVRLGGRRFFQQKQIKKKDYGHDSSR